MANDDMGMHESSMYREIASYAATVVGITVLLAFFGFVVHDCNEHNVQNQPEYTKQLQEKQKLETLCLASTCPPGQYRVFQINVDMHSNRSDGSCYCDVRILK